MVAGVVAGVGAWVTGCDQECLGEPTEVGEYTWAVADCEVADEDGGGGLRGEWTGVLTYDQEIGGDADSQEVEVTLLVAEYGVPVRQLPSLGFVGDWRVYYPYRQECPQDPSCFFARGAVGRASAYNGNEIDGPSNPLCFDRSALCSTETSVEWQYEVSFVFVDLVDYRGYDYADDGRPLATLVGHEHLEVDGDSLVVDSSATGTDETGLGIELRMSGVLVRP